MLAGAAGSATRNFRTAKEQRALLFGCRFGPGLDAERRGREMAEAKRLATEERALIEARNDELVDDLHCKVEQLRHVTLQVGEETDASLSIVNDLDVKFESALNVLR